jgi:capping protein beta
LLQSNNSNSKELIDEFTQSVDVPIYSKIDTNNKLTKPKKYIACEYNREKESYRSPWTNEYYPPLPLDNDSNEEEGIGGEGGMKPSLLLRNLEIQANQVFERYTYLYYGKNDDLDDEGNEIVSSVYFWDDNNSNSGRVGSGSNSSTEFKEGFSGCFLIRKMIDEPNDQKGYWNSIHHVDIGSIINGKSKYKLSTTVLVNIDVYVDNNDNDGGDSDNNNCITISGSLSKEVEQSHPANISTDHIANIGRMIEDVEIQLRTNLDVLHIQKTREIIDSIRPSEFIDGSGGRRSRGPTSIGGRGGIPGLMAGGMGMHGLPAAAQNEMNAALMARFKKSNIS